MLDRGPAALRDVAMATNFGKQFAIAGFVGYNSITLVVWYTVRKTCKCTEKSGTILP